MVSVVNLNKDVYLMNFDPQGLTTGADYNALLFWTSVQDWRIVKIEMEMRDYFCGYFHILRTSISVVHRVFSLTVVKIGRTLMILADDMDSKIRKSSSFISFFFSLFLCLLLSFFSVCLSFFVTLISFYFFFFFFSPSLSLHANRSSVNLG